MKRTTVYRAGLVILALGLLISCGGGSSSSSPPANGGGSSGSGGNGGGSGGGGGNGGGGGSGTGAVGPPVVINVSSGMTASGVDVQVPTPASSPAPNATLLGAATVPSTGGSVNISLTNGLANVHQGSLIIVAVAGDGISSNMTVTVSGPRDISVDTTSFKIITLKNGQNGMTFQATVLPSAALGARTVLLENTQQDMTAFAGGLQVVP